MDHGDVCVIGLGFGDESKGSITSYLAATHSFDCVVRFSGGCNTAHHVVHEPSGNVHRFSQFGSGTFEGVPTFLSRYMMVDPLRLSAEAEALEALGVLDPYSMLRISDGCRITTPYHAAANKAKERARGHNAHGSCGVGIGETAQLANMMTTNRFGPLMVADCAYPDAMAKKLRFILAYYTRSQYRIYSAEEVPTVDELMDAYTAFAKAVTILDGHESRDLIKTNACLFEGSQGVLLDEWYGFHPHTTWSTTTFKNADKLLSEAGKTGYHLGVLRNYTTRHGAGPLPTEDDSLLDSHPEPHNGTGVFQGAWRTGHFDAVLARYAIEVAGRVDGIALTHLDCPDAEICDSYEIDGFRVSDLIPNKTYDLKYQETMAKALRRAAPIYGTPRTSLKRHEYRIESCLGVPIQIESYGPKNSHKKGML